MIATSAIPAFLDAFADALAARADLAGVNVFSGPVAPDTAGLESIQFDHVEGTQRGRVGNTGREESFDVHGLIYVVTPTPPGKVEQSIRDARDRAFALLAAIETQLRDDTHAGQTVRRAEITDYPFDQGIAPDGGRAGRISFVLSIATYLPTT